MVRRLSPVLGFAVAVGAAFAVVAGVVPPVPAESVTVGQGVRQGERAVPPDGQLASGFPLPGTPHVMDGAVLGIARIGDTMVAVGSFTRVSPAGTYPRTQDDLTRRGIVAFDAHTGQIDRSFEVALRGGTATAIDTDGTSLYVGGSFTSVDGQARRSLVKLTTSGAVVPGFPAETDGGVDALVVRGTRVYVGGSFTHVGDPGHASSRSGLAALDAGTGVVLPSLRVPFHGVFTKRFGSTRVRQIDVTADGTRLVAIGNFTTVGGQARAQVAVLDTSGARARVTRWHTTRFDAGRNHCSRHIGSFVRDVDLAPDGSWFVVVTTGGYGGGVRAGTLCDSTSRWSTRRGGSPTWVDHTGGDTTNGVEVAHGAVYVGGHMRWENNPYAGNRPGPGAVPREGIAALDSTNGLPLSWNPGRARGVGAQAFLATADGLWIGSDTTLIGDQRRGRIALMPWQGGRTIRGVGRAQLSHGLFVVPFRGAGTLVQRHIHTTTSPPDGSGRVPSPLDWSKVRGAVYVNGTLFYGWSTGGFFRRGFDPLTGAVRTRHRVATRGLPFPARRLTGLVYEPTLHRLYYTLAGNGRLFYRAFTVDSRVLGAVEHVARGRGVRRVHVARVAGMTLAGRRLVYGSEDGALRSVRLRGGRVTGAPHVLSNDGSWRARALFVPND